MHRNSNSNSRDCREQSRARRHLDRRVFIVAMMSTATIDDTSTGIGSGVIIS
jgi:hypothetical protein